MGKLSGQIAITLLLLSGMVSLLNGQVQDPSADAGGNVRAVVIGISSYQDSAIARLRFANRDAAAFADFLKHIHNTGKQLPEISLLTDSEATLARIQSQLMWLLHESKKNDRAIIYFAGHADVETIDEREKGFLLAFDTPKNNYRMNALDIAFLHNVILAGLAHLDVQVIVVLDACHSGVFAGEAIGGVEYSARELGKRQANEVKILSCQSYELSQEGAEFGGGHGVFSYYLIDGLEGRADADNDRQVDVYELGEYLQKRVRAATGKAQHPEIMGGIKNHSLFVMEDSIQQNSREAAKVDLVHDFEGNVLQGLASRKGFFQYRKFKEQIKKGRLLTDDGNCASATFDLLYADTSMIPLRGIMTEQLVEAFLDSAQQAIVAYLKTDPQELELRDRHDKRYERFARYLARALEILGEKDPRYRETAAKQHYFSGLALRLEADRVTGSAGQYRAALKLQKEALQWEDRAAFIYNELGVLYFALDSLDQATEAFQRGRNLAPTWEIPCFNLGIVCSETSQNDEAKHLYYQAIRSKPDFASAYCYLGLLFDQLEQSDSADWAFRRAISLSPENPENFYNFAIHLSGLDDKASEAESMFQQAIALDSSYADAFFGLGNLYAAADRNDDAARELGKAVQLQPFNAEMRQNLGVLYYREGKNAEAENQFRAAIDADSLFTNAWTSLIFLYSDQWEKATQMLDNSPLDTHQRVLILCNAGSGMLNTGDVEHAGNAFSSAVNRAPAEPLGYCGLLFTAVAQNQPNQALTWMQKTLEAAQASQELEGYRSLIASNPKLKSLRKNKSYKTIMHSFFPDRY